MRVVVIADTHNQTVELPEGDILIHCGDATMNGTREEVERFDTWLGTLKYRHVIFTPGNHDFLFEKENIIMNAHVLTNKAIVVDNVVFWASPYTLTMFNWAFMKPEAELANIWRSIPDYVDVLITHGPPYGILDDTLRGNKAGSVSLRRRVEEIQPKVHVFGHIHESAGQVKVGNTLFVNASVVNEFYQNVHKPVVLEL